MRFADLFAGAGGFSAGIEMSGNEITYSVDNWEPAYRTYVENFNHKMVKMDISDVDSVLEKFNNFSDIDFIVGGPPCQDFSPAGKGIEGERAKLTIDYANIIRKSDVSYFIMENVPQVKKSSSYLQACQIFKDAGYGLTELIVDASYFDVPQKRKRLFLIGSKEHNDGYFEEFTRYGSIHPKTVREAIPDIGVDYYYRHPRSYQRRAIFSVDEPSPTIRGVNRPKPENYTHHVGDRSNKKNIRALSHSERSLIQTFPENYKWVGTKAENDQMLGNAVPPVLVKNLIEFIEFKISAKPEPKSFYEYLKSTEMDQSYESFVKTLKMRSSSDLSVLINEDSCISNSEYAAVNAYREYILKNGEKGES